jgi:quinol monooxygenase YgiN
MAFVLTAQWTAREGEQERVAGLLQELAGPSRDEPGCRFYQPCRDPDDPRVFLVFEIYDDDAAFQAHGASAHFQRIAVEQAFPLLESRERSFYETI